MAEMNVNPPLAGVHKALQQQERKMHNALEHVRIHTQMSTFCPHYSKPLPNIPVTLILHFYLT